MTSEVSALTTFLTAQRQSVLAIVDGLDERDLRRSVVPSGWTPLSMIAHLADAERQWFLRVVGGQVAVDPELGDPDSLSSVVVLDLYREQVALSDEVLAGEAMDAVPAGTVQPDMVDEIHTVRDVVLHMIEETARHAGHLDIARELLDGRTGLGPR